MGLNAVLHQRVDQVVVVVHPGLQRKGRGGGGRGEGKASRHGVDRWRRWGKCLLPGASSAKPGCIAAGVAGTEKPRCAALQAGHGRLHAGQIETRASPHVLEPLCAGLPRGMQVNIHSRVGAPQRPACDRMRLPLGNSLLQEMEKRKWRRPSDRISWTSCTWG